MAEVPSTFQLQPGQIAPDFTLPDGHGREYTLESLCSQQKGLLIAFVCNHCPFVIHLAKELGRTAASLAEKGIVTVAINANDLLCRPTFGPPKEGAQRRNHTRRPRQTVSGCGRLPGSTVKRELTRPSAWKPRPSQLVNSGLPGRR